MDIKITCRACGRTYPLTMATDPESRPGYCPFCGEVLVFQYASTFVDTARRATEIGAEFERQLRLLAEMAGGFALDVPSVLNPVADAVAAQNPKIAEPYRPQWPPQRAEIT